MVVLVASNVTTTGSKFLAARAGVVASKRTGVTVHLLQLYDDNAKSEAAVL